MARPAFEAVAFHNIPQKYWNGCKYHITIENAKDYYF